MKKTVFVLDMKDVREGLVQWNMSLLEDKKNMLELFRTEGNLNSFLPNLASMSEKEMVVLFGELNLGEKIGFRERVDMVVVQHGDYDYTMVWDKENLEPEFRAGFDAFWLWSDDFGE